MDRNEVAVARRYKAQKILLAFLFKMGDCRAYFYADWNQPAERVTKIMKEISGITGRAKSLRSRRNRSLSLNAGLVLGIAEEGGWHSSTDGGRPMEAVGR